jgi:hypothetical protein
MELWPLIRERKAWRRWGIASLVLGFGLMTLVFFHAPLVKALNPPLDRDPTNEVYGWPDLGPAMTRALKKWPGKEPPAFVFGVRYQIASLAAFYGPGQPRTACLFLPGERLNTYLYWHDIAALAGRDGVAVVDYPMNEATAALFESVQELAYVSLVNLTGRVGHDLGVYYCQGFKGKDARPEEFVGAKESRD